MADDLKLVAENIERAHSGALFYSPLGTAIPTSLNDPLNTAYVSYGWISPDGIEVTLDNDTAEIEAWQDGSVVQTFQTKFKCTLKATFLETTDLTLKTYFADPDGTRESVTASGKQPEEFTGVLLFLSRGRVGGRIVVPSMNLISREPLGFKVEDALAYGCEFSMNASSQLEGGNFRMFNAPAITSNP